MITEKGKVVAIDTDGIWVETANQSACGRCSARKGCGQTLLAQVDGHRSYLKAGLNGYSRDDFREGDVITIGVHETAVLRGSLLVYCMPLLGLMAGAATGDTLGLHEFGVAASAACGLIISSLVVRGLSRNHSRDKRFQPFVAGTSIDEAFPAVGLDVVEP